MLQSIALQCLRLFFYQHKGRTFRMKVWLMTLGLTLLCSVFAVANIEEMTGPWHNAAMASDCKCIMKHKDNMKMTVVNLAVENPGSVTMETNIPMPGGCKKIKLEFTKKENGHYFHACEHGAKTIQEADTTQEGMLTVKSILEKNGKTCRMWSFLTRERTANSEKTGDFVRKAEAAGFTPEQIKVMPPEVACIESQ